MVRIPFRFRRGEAYPCNTKARLTGSTLVASDHADVTRPKLPTSLLQQPFAFAIEHLYRPNQQEHSPKMFKKLFGEVRPAISVAHHIH